MLRIAVGVAVGTMAAAALLAGNVEPVAAQAGADKPAFYTEKVRPIFQDHCGRCHMGMNHRGGMSMETQAGMMKGGRDGVMVVAGDPAHSELLALIRHEGPADDPMPMPPKEGRISDADIAIVTAWIKAGAVMPPDVAK